MTELDPGPQAALALCRQLNVTPQQLQRMESLLRESPLKLSELGEIGWQTPLGQRVLPQFTYYRTPKAFPDWRAFAGTRLLLDAAQQVGLITGTGEAFHSFLQAPTRFIRSGMAQALLNAEPYPVEPEMPAPFERLLLVLPDGINGDDLDCPIALGLTIRNGEHGIAMTITGWGRNAGTWIPRTESKPTDGVISRLAWGALGLLACDAELIDHDQPPAPTGRSMRRSIRPEPCWLMPPRHHRYLSQAELTELSKGCRRSYWRRGHTRRQPYGPKNSLRKRIWVAPIWVQGFGEEDEKT
jgi:hypothetical protein